MRKALAIMIMMTLAISTYSLVIPANASTTTLPDYQGIDIANAPSYPFYVEEPIQGPSHHSYWDIGDTAIWALYDDYQGGYWLAYYQLRAIGTTAEVWVQMNLKWRTGDPRPNPVILDTQVQYILNEFESKILPTDTQYFGDPIFRDGSYAALPDQLGLPADYYTEASGRNVILISNIRDENYYDSSYPYFIIGFFTSVYDYFFDRNVVTLDCANWELRLGPPGTEWTPGVIVDKYAYDYESTLAHEYQHLIHNVWQPADDLYMNEGCSMYAQMLCGYGAPVTDINSYFYTPDNSLTFWGDQGGINILADYGVAALWTIYLSDHYGGADLISYFVKSGVPGSEGINNALAYFGYKVTFDEVYHDWRIANLVRSDCPGNGKYNYKSINLNDPKFIPVTIHETSGLPVSAMKGSDLGTTLTILGFDTGVSEIQPYGTDYIKFQNWKKLGIIGFSGDRLSGWEYDTAAGYWWSGYSDLYNALLVGSARVNPAKPYLTLVTMYGIESYWDFGFVQVSTDNGKTWTSLANEYTTTDYVEGAHPDIIANLPGLTDYSPDVPDWTTMTFDLTPYAGQKVMIGFRYMTDWATTYEGWFIKSASVSDKALKLTPVFPEVNWQVTLVYAMQTRSGTVYVPWDMWLCDPSQTGMALAYANKPNYVIMVVTPIMHSGWADYQFSALPLGFHCH